MKYTFENAKKILSNTETALAAKYKQIKKDEDASIANDTCEYGVNGSELSAVSTDFENSHSVFCVAHQLQRFRECNEWMSKVFTATPKKDNIKFLCMDLYSIKRELLCFDVVEPKFIELVDSVRDAFISMIASDPNSLRDKFNLYEKALVSAKMRHMSHENPLYKKVSVETPEKVVTELEQQLISF